MNPQLQLARRCALLNDSIRIYTLITLLVAMNSCSLYQGCDKDNELVTLSEDTRQWIPYSQIDEVIFKNESIQSAVRILEFTESVETYDRGDECSPGTKEVMLTKLSSVLFTDTIKIKLTRQKVDLENTNFQLTYLEDTKTVYPTTDINKQFLNTLTIDQKVFNEVLISKCPTCNDLSEIVFSKNNGLVAFKLNNVYWTKK
jgi:hypothetical protein